MDYFEKLNLIQLSINRLKTALLYGESMESSLDVVVEDVMAMLRKVTRDNPFSADAHNDHLKGK